MESGEFLRRIQDLAGLSSSEEADRWAMTVLLGLMHLLPDRHKRRRFITELPDPPKGKLQEEPPGALRMDLDSFLQHVAAGLGGHAPDGERAVRVVYRVLREAISPGELAQVEASLPDDVAAFLKRAA